MTFAGHQVQAHCRMSSSTWKDKLYSQKRRQVLSPSWTQLKHHGSAYIVRITGQVQPPTTASLTSQHCGLGGRVATQVQDNGQMHRSYKCAHGHGQGLQFS